MLPSGARFHYSNLAFALLGIVVERVSGMPYMDYVRERLFEPVGLTRMSFEPESPAAKGYLAQPYADGVWDTIGVETGAWASAGQLWGTVGDICRWGAFLAESRRVGARAVERRGDAHGAGDRRPRALAIGLRARSRAQPRRRADPRRPQRLDARLHRAAPLLGEGEGRGRGADERERGGARRARAPARARRRSRSGRSRPRRGAIGEPPPDEVVPLLGIWFMEAARLVLRWRDGTARGGASTTRPTGSRRRSSSGRRTTGGAPSRGRSTARRCGSVRGADGSIEQMVWAGYPVTREPGPWRAPDAA